MKALFTLLVILFTGAATIAQNPSENEKVETITHEVVLVDSIVPAKEIKTPTIKAETSVARLYRYKNSRVNKELAFITNTNYSKLA